MEYCAGGTLESVIDRAAKQRELVPEIRLWQYLAQILEALKYCHSPRTDREPVIHRDLKPGNGMLGVATYILGDQYTSRSDKSAQCFWTRTAS